ncbi:HepT-like ribonuclease domain-containing protein [Egbenema bharatensis]|uniref:HepT-like ribonuclease domain-containing protein n=1 Tax=Egbenema bharatensis TaxID=3463334 RepID=UPI003A8C3884
MKSDLLYLTNIKDCIQRIETYTIEGREKFLGTPMIQDAVIRNFEIIDEATKRLSPELTNTYPDIAWKQIARLRDILIHDYLKVNLNRIWGIIEQDLPNLKQAVESILHSS